MTIPNSRALKHTAAQRLEQSPNAKTVVLVYAGITIVMALFVTVVGFVLQNQISQFGGLRNMGTKTLLSTIQSILPMAQSIISLCLQLGYMAAMLRVSREQYVSPHTLRLGFDRFWPLFRCMLIQSAIYLLVGIATFYLAVQIFLLTPFSARFVELVMPLAYQIMEDPTVILNDVLYNQLVTAMVPMFVIYVILFLAVLLPIHYSYRMANYVLIEKPAGGGLFALRESRKMMKRNRLALAKLDLSLWWYYLLTLGSSAICYADSLLPMVGISLPMSENVSYFLFYGLFLVCQFGICYFLQNRVEVIYAQAYDALRPKEQQTGAVLGNIFQM